MEAYYSNRKGDENTANTMRSQKRLIHLNVLFRHIMTIGVGVVVVVILVFYATFSNISVVSWRSVLLEEETRVPEKFTISISLNIHFKKKDATKHQ